MSRLCRLRNASHGDDGQWAYSEIVGLREQLAALAEQNKLLRGFAHERHDALLDQFVTAMPNLATPVLNRIRAEGMEEAAKFVEDTFDLCGDELMIAERIRARKAELEKSK